MRITERDVRLARDIALSHLLSRDQAISLGYFGSVTRANARLRELAKEGVLKRLDTPFFGQSLYCAGPEAPEIVGERIAPVVSGRAGSPRFVRHALAVTDVRVALAAKGAKVWRFEQQLACSFAFAGKRYDVRPDGSAFSKGGPLLVEVDMGNASRPKLREKLAGYRAFAESGEAMRTLGQETVRLLAVTTTKTRAASLASLAPDCAGLEVLVQTFDDLGVKLAGTWS